MTGKRMRKICTKRDTDTFDWDEAVIYMTCTDRFFDGNTKNDEGVNKSGSLSYHGYWAKDFTKLNPYLGTEEELESLINALHKRGMKLMVDVVLNHAGYGTEDYFNSILKDQDGNSISMIRDKDTTITGDDVRDSLSGLPDFVTENADVRNQLVEWQTEWMTKYDIDYYRVDTVKHVDATTWATFKNSLTKANPDFKMIGEYAGAGYANTAGELVTEKNLTEEEALKVFKVAAALQITAKGQAVIYYGEETGQHGLNIKDADQTISIPVSEAAGSTMTDLYSGKTYTVSTDGKVEITIPKAVDGGTVILKKETSSNGGSSSSTGTTETVKNDTTTVTNPDGSKTETTVIKDLPADTKASLNVTTDANGNKTSEASVETKGTEKKSGVSTSVSADVVKAITDKAKTTDVTIKQEVKKADGSTAYTVEVSAGDVKAGENLKLLKKDAKAAVKEIKKTVKATKTSTNVKKKKTTKFPWSKKLNMANVDKITYTSSKKSVVTVNKNGKITAKKKGTAKVKAVVTLKDGTKKTVTMKVKVK